MIRNYKLILDNDNYIVSAIHTNTEEDIFALDLNKMHLYNLDCYYVKNNAVVFDEEKYNQEMSKKDVADAITLEERINDLEIAICELMEDTAE